MSRDKREDSIEYRAIIDDLLNQMKMIYKASHDLYAKGVAIESIGRAKQKLEQIK